MNTKKVKAKKMKLKMQNVTTTPANLTHTTKRTTMIYQAPWKINTGRGQGKTCRARKRKFDLPPKLRIHPTINGEAERSKILHASTMVQTIGNTHLDLRGYACLHATLYCEPNQQDNVMRNPLVTTIITQYHVFKVLKLFGEPGVAAILKELKQLHGRMFVDLKNADKMTTCQKKLALQYLMFLNKKRCGKINGRGCADGRKPHKYLIKDYTRAPTVAMEALFLTCLIDAMDHHEVVTLDIHGAFMQADTEGETVHMKLEGKMADLLTKLDPKLYQKYVTN